MPKIKILSDSSCDLSPELIRKYEIGIVPFSINLGGDLLLDGSEIGAEGIFAYVRKNNILPGTVACTIDEFQSAFRKWREQGYEVICHTISSKMSCSCQNARIAAEGMDGVTVVDSQNLSTGVGHLVIQSALMARSGMQVAEIVRELEALRPKVSASFILDNLEYMRKGGRCSSVTLLGANLLRIKPEILVEDGEMKVGRKLRGPLPRVLEEYVNLHLAEPEKIRPDRIFITHTGCSPEIVETVRARILKNMAFEEILETRAGGTITSHSGPNTLGILYIER